MAKFDTRVAGVTHYNVDFSSIKKSSRVEIVPEPDCPYDNNALQVVINGAHVGYLKKGFNETICRAIKQGHKVSARVQAVIGQGKENQGIALRIVVDDGFTAERKGDSLGIYNKTLAPGISVFRATLPHMPEYDTEDLLLGYWDYKNKLPPIAELPKEPDYRMDYEREVPLLKRLWSETYNAYRDRRRKQWLEACAKPKRQNEERARLLKQLNATRAAEKWSFDSYVCSIKLIKLLEAIQASVPCFDRPSEVTRFVTVYEQAIYDLLHKTFHNIYHQVTIGGEKIDLLCLPDDLSSAWAIEIDGGIHSRVNKIEQDILVQKKLARLGVSLIRIRNFVVSKGTEECVKQILEIINYKPPTKSGIETKIDSLLAGL